MEFLHDFFLKGHYDKCLEALQNSLQTDVLEDAFIIENNKCVSQCLVSLSVVNGKCGETFNLILDKTNNAGESCA